MDGSRDYFTITLRRKNYTKNSTIFRSSVFTLMLTDITACSDENNMNGNLAQLLGENSTPVRSETNIPGV